MLFRSVWVMLGFGLLGFVLREMRYPMAPLVLGIVLGPILDENLRRGLVLNDGDLAPFFTQPIAAVLGKADIMDAEGRLNGGLGAEPSGI